MDDSAPNPRFLTPPEVNALPGKPANHRLTYGSDPLQFGDLRLPERSGPHPLAVVIHGGCWISAFADLQYTAAFSDALRDAGIATWNIEYRRVDHPGGGWPGTFVDIAEAVDHVRQLALTHDLDLNRVITIGHSSGGTMALWAAARGRLPSDSPLYRADSLRLRGALVLGGPGDLTAFAKTACDVCGSPVVARLLGGTVEEVPDHYRQGSPIELLPFGIRQILITGEQDASVAKGWGAAYATTARLVGDDVDHVIVANAAHHEYCAPTAVTWPVVLKSALSLLGV